MTANQKDEVRKLRLKEKRKSSEMNSDDGTGKPNDEHGNQFTRKKKKSKVTFEDDKSG